MENDLIRRSDVLCGKFVSTDSIYERGWNDALDAVAENAPAVDAVEVVRCSDCVHFEPFRQQDGFCKIDGMLRENDFFCKNGQRREGDGDG